MREFIRMARGHSDFAAMKAGKNPFARQDTEEDRQRLAELAKERGLM
jgi:hypothetical protein